VEAQRDFSSSLILWKSGAILRKPGVILPRDFTEEPMAV
jgi:hypothetical protein